MKPTALTIVALSLGAGLLAQTPTVAITALASASVNCTSGTQSASNALPAGPLGYAFATTATLGPTGSPFLSARVDGFAIWSPSRMQITTTNFLVGTGVGVQQAAQASQDLLVQLSAPSAVPVVLSVVPTVLLSPGMPAPVQEIDVGNDGLIDWDGTFGAGPLGNFVLGPQPLLVRIRLASDLPIPLGAQFETSTSAITIHVDPDNQVLVTQNVVGCAGAAMQTPVPVFDGRGVDLLGNPGVFVIGFGVQPVLLGPQSPLPFFPGCLLMPTPDVLSFAPFGQLRISLPTAVRPATLYVQAVDLSAPYRLTDGYRLVAL